MTNDFNITCVVDWKFQYIQYMAFLLLVSMNNIKGNDITIALNSVMEYAQEQVIVILQAAMS